MTKEVGEDADEWQKESFWKRPAFRPSEVGDPLAEHLYMSVEVGLSAWEDLEDVLSSFFQSVWIDRNRPTSPITSLFSHQVFGSVESSTARLNLLQLVVSLYFENNWEYELVRRPFLRFFKVVSHASHRRNEIAHGRVSGASIQQKDGSFKNSGYFLTSPPYAISRNQPHFGGVWHKDDVLGSDRSKYRYRASDIFLFASTFRILRDQAWHLMHECSFHETRVPNIIARLSLEAKIGPAYEIKQAEIAKGKKKGSKRAAPS